jgi:hypothetical protein
MAMKEYLYKMKNNELEERIIEINSSELSMANKIFENII